MRSLEDEDIWDRDPAGTRMGCFILLTYIALLVLIVAALVFDWGLPWV